MREPLEIGSSVAMNVFRRWGIAVMSVLIGVAAAEPVACQGGGYSSGWAHHAPRLRESRSRPSLALDAKAEGKFVPDQHWDEHGTCFNVKDRGLVVISSCGRVGIVNTVRQAIEVSGVSKVHAVVGGFHLFA